MTTIKIPSEILKKLADLKIHPRQPYHEVIAALLKEHDYLLKEHD